MATAKAAEEQVSGLIDAHRQQMEALMAAHTQRIEKAQSNFAEMIVSANDQLKSLIQSAEPPQEPKPEKPQAVWSNGMLVLNREAAGLIEELLSRTGEVLSEVGKLVSTKPKLG